MASAVRLPKLRQESLAQRAYTELKHAILSGELEPGASLAEVDLAEALGISRTPVREALALLRSEGLVDAASAGGSVVRVLTEDEVRELFLLRQALETLAIRERIRVGSDASTEELEELIRRQGKAASRGDVEAFLAADEAFHLAICRQAGLSEVTRLLGSLREKMRQAGLRAVTNRERMRTVLDEHRAIVESIAKGSARAGEKAVTAHLSATQAAFHQPSDGRTAVTGG